MRKNGSLIIVVVLLLAGMGTYIFLKQKATTPSPANTTTTNAPTDNTTIIQPTVDASDLQAGGSSFKDNHNVFTILYPSDYKIDTSDLKHPRIYKTGATQKGQTEMYDGVLVVFETVELNGKSLSQWVDEHIQASTADGTSKVVNPKKSFLLKTYSGFVYEIQGFGTAKYSVVQKDTNSDYAVVITTSVQDPQNVGFQKEVDKILSTIELLK